MTKRKKLSHFLFYILLLSGLLGGKAYAQVVIPRDGFPYCEPFTNSTTRANTVFDGVPNKAILTSGGVDPNGNGVLRLTTNDINQRGWVFVDLPFSSAYGIKTSFEYFAYGPISPNEPGDGFSFFLFDGSIVANDNVPPVNPNEFQIGGLGGSLGYSPLRYSGGNFGGGYGLKGAFMGIGLDARGNWGNQYEGRYGGFANPFQYGSGLAPAFFPRYPNNIAIRGPVDPADVVRDNGMTGQGSGFPATFPDPPLYPSYPFIDGKILNNDPADGAPYTGLPAKYFLSPAQRFTVGAPSRITNCAINGYRKVFIDLKPNGAGKYTISMSMLITTPSGPQVVPIFSNVPYPYTAPQNLKVGFAASTGDRTSFHEIRNVTVEVSSIDPALAPNPPNLNEKVCFDEDLTFDFDVSLPAQNQFIRCLQLFPTNPGPPNNTPNPNGDPFVGNCGLSGVCVEKCKPENKTIVVPGVGTFESILENLTDQNFGNERNEAKIKFTPVPGFFGTHTIYYNVIDNYGLTSESRTVTVTVNPFPKIDSQGAIIGPTCNGQNDGSITNVVLKDLIPGYSFNWKDQNGNILPASSYTKTETTVGSYLQATVGVNGVNLGKYYLTVNNPATNSACDDIFEFEIKDVRGTPVEVVLDDQQICQGTPVIFSPQLEDPTDAANPKFVWWKDNQKTKPITNGLTEGAVKYQITGAGILTITGLAQSATPLEFFVEVAADVTQNLCATPAGQLKRVQVLVLPPLNISATVTDDLCRQGTGKITVTATGGFPTKTYSLNGGPFQASNTFSNLLPGTYTIDVNAGTNCIGTITSTIKGPNSALSITYLNQVNPSCGLNNGVLRFQAAGGTPNYTFSINGAAVSPVLSGGIYTISGLAPAPNYTVQVTDSNSCLVSFISPSFSAIPIPTFSAVDDVICPGETAILTPTIIELSNATNLTYTWKDKSGNNLVNGGGITYSVNSTTGALSISGLQENPLPYEYTLVVGGTNICNNTPIPAKVTVNPAPKLSAPTIVNVSCFGENTGSITLNPSDPAQAANYQYSINGGVSFQASPVFGSLTAKSYDFIIRNTITGCTSSLNGVTVTQPAELILNLTKFIQPACGVPNGLIEVSFSGGTSGYKLELLLNGAVIQTSNTPSSPTVYNNLAPGNYQIRITDNLSCVKTVNQTLINDVGIPITVAPMIDELCFGDVAKITPAVTTTGSAELKWYKDAGATQEIVSSPTPDSNGHIFTINSSTQELTVGGLNAGDYKYYLVAKGPGYCPNPPFVASVKVYEPITSTMVVTDEICFGAKDGTITVNATGADGKFEYSLNNGPFVSNKVFTALSPGIYTISIRSTGNNGCTFQTTATVNGPSAAIAVNKPNIIRSSCDLPNGSIENLAVTGGWGNYTAEWRKGSLTGPIVPGGLTGAVNLLTDTYYLTIKDQKGCTVSFNFKVDEMPDPIYVIAPVEICAGESVILKPVNIVSGSAPTDLEWYKDSGKTQKIVNGPDSSDPAISYSIDPLTSNLTITGLPGRNVPYSFYLNVVCTKAIVKGDALVRVVPNPVFAPEPVTCFGGNDGRIVIQSGGDAKYQYSVDGGALITEAQLEARTFAAKKYSVTVSNDGFCLTSFEVEVKQPLAALAVAPLSKVDPSCGANIGIIRTQITGGWAPYSVTLFRNGTSVNTQTVQGPAYEINNLSPGQYNLRITDAEGCVINSNTITMVFGPTQILVDDAVVCEGETAILKPIPNPIPTGAVFEWFKNSALTIPVVSSPTPDANGHIFQIAADGTLSVSGLKSTDSPVTYYVRISGGNSCPGFTAAPKVTVNRLPGLAASIKDEVCFGEKGTITFTGSAGDGTFAYSLDGVTFQSANTFVVNPGIYTGYVKSGAGCLVQLPNLVVKGPVAPLEVTLPSKQDATCNESDGNISFEINGGYNSTYTVQTKRNGQPYKTDVVTAGLYNLINLPSGTYSFTVTDTGGCAVTLPSQVQVEDIPTPIDSNDDIICEGETATLKPTTTQTGITPLFTWYLNSNGTGQILPGTSNGITYQIASDGTLSISGLQGRQNPYVYYLKISGTGVCEPPIIPVEVLVYDIPNLRVSNPSIVCDPMGTVDLTEFIEGFDPNTYDYQILSPTGSLMRVDEIGAVNQSGSYQVQNAIKGSNCWSPNQRIQVVISEQELLPDFNYEADLGGGNFLTNSEAQILEKVNFIDNSLGKVIIWNWEFGDGSTSSEENPSHIYTKKGTYTVTLTTIDEIGCIAVTEKIITVLDDYVIIIPNAFTPNGQKNQYFKPQFRGIASMEVYIFNTWGELIFESNSMETLGWDGTLNGKNVPNGNYVYRAVFQTRSGEKIEKSGVFILIR